MPELASEVPTNPRVTNILLSFAPDDAQLAHLAEHPARANGHHAQVVYHAAGRLIHTRFVKARPKHRFPFNVSGTTLKADFELWICGHPQDYYLLPRAEVIAMYDDPDAYPDRHPLYRKLKMVTTNIEKHRVLFAAGGKARDLSQFFRTRLRAPT
jgi:hypothetical protein